MNRAQRRSPEFKRFQALVNDTIVQAAANMVPGQDLTELQAYVRVLFEDFGLDTPNPVRLSWDGNNIKLEVS